MSLDPNHDFAGGAPARVASAHWERPVALDLWSGTAAWCDGELVDLRVRDASTDSGTPPPAPADPFAVVLPGEAITKQYSEPAASSDRADDAHAPPAPRLCAKRGPKPKAQIKATAALRELLARGRTPEQLRDLDQEALARDCGVGRRAALKARDSVLSAIVAK